MNRTGYVHINVVFMPKELFENISNFFKILVEENLLSFIWPKDSYQNVKYSCKFLRRRPVLKRLYWNTQDTVKSYQPQFDAVL